MNGTAAVAMGVLVTAGAAMAVQAPVNASLGRSIGASVPAAAVSFGTGCLILTVIALVLGQGGGFLALGRAAPWQFLGGALGALYVWGAIWSVGSLGVVTMIAAVILGQMLGAMTLDATGALGLDVRELSPTRLLAVAMVAGGLVLSRF
ncbi:DMT family transporter [Rubellimicrobium arenae]|uniref:DMT family transporter n=1 Tax=Rubellimicrobium arenae TaxID=2817372 RepID=UPI001B30A0A3|nr:DMT family transporter [Rubellimicrobium arenae]